MKWWSDRFTQPRPCMESHKFTWDKALLTVPMLHKYVRIFTPEIRTPWQLVNMLWMLVLEWFHCRVPLYWHRCHIAARISHYRYSTEQKHNTIVMVRISLFTDWLTVCWGDRSKLTYTKPYENSWGACLQTLRRQRSKCSTTQRKYWQYKQL